MHDNAQLIFKAILSLKIFSEQARFHKKEDFRLQWSGCWLLRLNCAELPLMIIFSIHSSVLICRQEQI